MHRDGTMSAASSGNEVDSEKTAMVHATSEDEDDMESWVEWIKPTTRDVETKYVNLKLPFWDTVVLRRRWLWAGKVACLQSTR